MTLQTNTFVLTPSGGSSNADNATLSTASGDRVGRKWGRRGGAAIPHKQLSWEHAGEKWQHVRT